MNNFIIVQRQLLAVAHLTLPVCNVPNKPTVWQAKRQYQLSHRNSPVLHLIRKGPWHKTDNRY